MSYDLNELDKLHAGAIPDPWGFDPSILAHGRGYIRSQKGVTVAGPLLNSDAELLVALRNAYPALSARLKALEGEVAAARELLTKDGEDTYLGAEDGVPMGLQQDYAAARALTDATSPTKGGAR